MGGFQSDLNAQQVLSLLANVSQPIKDNSVRPSRIYGRDLVIAVDILAKMAEYNNNNKGSVSSGEDFENYAQVASNLLESTNSRTWKGLEKVRLLFSVGITLLFSGEAFPSFQFSFRTSQWRIYILIIVRVKEKIVPDILLRFLFTVVIA